MSYSDPSFNTITKTLTTSLESFTNAFVSIAGSILGALLLLLTGWLVARFVRYMLLKFLNVVQFDTLAEKLNLQDMLNKANIQLTPSAVIAKFVYWIILLLFFIITTNFLGWTVISEKLNEFINFLPTLLSGIVLFVFGYYITSFLRDIILAATSSLGIGAGRMIAGFVFYFFLIVVTITALDQIGINTNIITSNVVMILGAILGAAAISYGFASRDILANILAAFFSRKTFQEGQIIRVDSVQGEIIQSNNISVTVEVPSGDKVIIPMKELISKKIYIIIPKEPEPNEIEFDIDIADDVMREIDNNTTDVEDL